VAYLHHASFEIHDFDDQVLGHEWLQTKGWRNFWGIGRHVVGSQVFPASPEYLSVWGPAMPADFLD
jgi:hypothetical protein